MKIEELARVPYWSEEEGRYAVAIWRKSGESLSTFERRTGIARRRIAYWRDHVEGHAGRAAGREIELATVEVAARERASTRTSVALAVGGPTAPSGSIAIELANGRVVRIEGEVADETIARAIVIAERAC